MAVGLRILGKRIELERRIDLAREVQRVQD